VSLAVTGATRTDFRGADLTRVTLKNSNLTAGDFRDAQMRRIDLTHVSEESPRGPYVAAANDENRFRVTNRTRTYNLASNITYSPASVLSLTLSPSYRAETAGSTDGLQKSLNMAGGASVNLPVGNNGSLSGSMSRTYNVRSAADGTGRGIGAYSWSGSLQFTWKIDS
jgi:hypothetical protein